MGQTIAEKILSAHNLTRAPAKAGDLIGVLNAGSTGITRADMLHVLLFGELTNTGRKSSRRLGQRRPEGNQL